jgi:hypothetical protein
MKKEGERARVGDKKPRFQQDELRDAVPRIGSG